MILAARVYRFRAPFRQQAASVFGEIAVGSHTGEWPHALDKCGDDTRELVEAFERVAEREQLDLAGPLSELGHVNDATPALWSRRLQLVADHPLGKRSSHGLGSRYVVPPEFLREQDAAVIHQYVDKLVAIGTNPDEMVVNRAGALAAAANVVDLLPSCKKKQLGNRLRPLTDQEIQISEADRFSASSLHSLSRFRVSLGSATHVRASAGWLLGRAATGSDECKLIVEVALAWVRSDDLDLQHTGALILTLPNLSTSNMPSAELATVLLQLSGRVASAAFDLACEGAGRGRPPLWERRDMAGWTDTAGRPAVALP